RVVPVPAHRRDRLPQLPPGAQDPGGGRLSTFAYRVRPQARRIRRRSYRRAGPLTYVFLLLLAVGSAFPLYWSFVVASHDNSALGAYPPVLTPGGHLWSNVRRLFDAGIVNVDFWTALANSAIVAGVVTICVVL